jgi:hypothetical protein
MHTQRLSAILMAAGLLVSAPAFAQTKQPTQEGGPSMASPSGAPFNANPNYKQKTQEGGPSMATPGGAPYNADPNYKQRTQSLVPSPGQGAAEATHQK